MNARDQLELDYEHLFDGQTVAGERCPVCEGGDTRERSLSVTKREGLLLYRCHRDSCDFSGAIANGSGRYAPATKTPDCRGVVGRTILRDCGAVPPEIGEYLRNKYNITHAHRAKFEIGWYADEDRLAIPVKDFLGNRLGVNLRALDNRKPKAKLQVEDNAISWFVNPTSPDIIIVEDQFSAIRASDFLTSVALLGTHLNEDNAYEIRKNKKGRVFLALDADAWAKAVKYAIQFRSLLKLELVTLTKDIKDLTDEELKDLFKRNGIIK